MKKFNSGEIYFIREGEYRTGNPSPFVKIGLVRYSEKRDSFGRLAEHQTGNPRRLLLDKSKVVETQAVDMVEARLHQIYAKQRISGEWFEFPDEASLSDAIANAHRLSEEVSLIIPRFEIADELERQESKEKSRLATAAEVELGFVLKEARDRVKACEGLESEVKAYLSKAISEGTDVTVAARHSVKEYKPVFLEDKFKLENQAIWNSYQKVEEKWYHSFLPKSKVENPNPHFEAEIESIANRLEAAKGYGDLSEIVEVSLALTNLKGLASWEDKVATTELKISMGLCEGLEGVCSWKRYWNKTTKFDSDQFATDHPDLAKKYVSTPEPKVQVKPKKTKS